MPEEVAKPPETKTPVDDGIKNLKAEFDRKLGNIEQTNQALLRQLQVLSTPVPKKEPVKPIKDIWYDDPDAAASMIKEQAKADIRKELQAEGASQQKKNTVIQGLYREYPELADFDNPLTLKAVENFEKLSDEEKSNPIAYRLAVKEAAEELEIKPKAKRKPKEDDDDSFSLSGGQPAPKGTRGRKSDALDEKTVRFAKLVGMNTDDEKVIEGLKKSSQRKNWMTWE